MTELARRPKVYGGERLVTFQDIAAVHGCSVETVRSAFKRNVEQYIEGQDYFWFNSNQKGRRPRAFTEAGYYLLCKSMNDPLAWEVYKRLRAGYFHAKQISQAAPNALPAKLDALAARLDSIEPKVDFLYQAERSRPAPRVAVPSRVVSAHDRFVDECRGGRCAVTGRRLDARETDHWHGRHLSGMFDVWRISPAGHDQLGLPHSEERQAYASKFHAYVDDLRRYLGGPDRQLLLY